MDSFVFAFFSLFLVLTSVPHTPEGNAEIEQINAARSVVFTWSSGQQARAGL